MSTLTSRRSTATVLTALAVLAATGLGFAGPAQAVPRSLTTTTLTADLDAVREGDTVVLTAHVSSGSALVTGGSVAFSGKRDIGCGPVPVVAGVASCSVAVDWLVSQDGTVPFDAHYSGDQRYRKSLGRLVLPFEAVEPLRLKDYAGHAVAPGAGFTVRGLRALYRTSRPQARRVIFVAADGPFGAQQSVRSIESGRWHTSPLYTKVADSDDSDGAGGSNGTVEVWESTKATDSVRPEAVLGKPGFGGLIGHAAFFGAAPVKVLANTHGSWPGTATVEVTPTTTGSQIWVIGHDTCLAGRTPVDGATMRDSATPRQSGTAWLQTVDAASVAGTPVTVGLKTPACGAWQLIAVEIAPAQQP
ncbi:MAG: hypothetical protein U0Q15_00095 [Kineosporiaceae bacterium]